MLLHRLGGISRGFGLRAEGRVTVEGLARATRYHATGRLDQAALRSRHLHRLAARRIAMVPALRGRALERPRVLSRANSHGRSYHDRWQTLIDGPLPDLLRVMTEDSEQADALRKESPLSILAIPAERRRVFSAIPLG